MAGAEEGDVTVTKRMWIGMQNDQRQRVVSAALGR